MSADDLLAFNLDAIAGDVFLFDFGNDRPADVLDEPELLLAVAGIKQQRRPACDSGRRAGQIYSVEICPCRTFFLRTESSEACLSGKASSIKRDSSAIAFAPPERISAYLKHPLTIHVLAHDKDEKRHAAIELKKPNGLACIFWWDAVSVDENVSAGGSFATGGQSCFDPLRAAKSSCVNLDRRIRSDAVVVPPKPEGDSSSDSQRTSGFQEDCLSFPEVEAGWTPKLDVFH